MSPPGALTSNGSVPLIYAPADVIKARLIIESARRAGVNGARSLRTNGYELVISSVAAVPCLLFQAENFLRHSAMFSITCKLNGSLSEINHLAGCQYCSGLVKQSSRSTNFASSIG